jgi:hypothetical protein
MYQSQNRAVEDMDSANAVSITKELPRHLEPPTAQIKAKEDVLFQDTIPKYMYISKSHSPVLHERVSQKIYRN